jgi:hypothetical protein
MQPRLADWVVSSWSTWVVAVAPSLNSVSSPVFCSAKTCSRAAVFTRSDCSAGATAVTAFKAVGAFANSSVNCCS